MYISTEVLIGIILCLFFILAYIIFKYSEINREIEEKRREKRNE